MACKRVEELVDRAIAANGLTRNQMGDARHLEAVRAHIVRSRMEFRSAVLNRLDQIARSAPKPAPRPRVRRRRSATALAA